MSGAYRLSKRQVQRLFPALLDVSISTGMVVVTSPGRLVRCRNLSSGEMAAALVSSSIHPEKFKVTNAFAIGSVSKPSALQTPILTLYRLESGRFAIWLKVRPGGGEEMSTGEVIQRVSRAARDPFNLP